MRQVRVVLVPGFTQTADSWEPVIDALAERRATPSPSTCPKALDFASTAPGDRRAAGAGIYVGYSMGGRLCLRLALDRPDLVRGLVLVSASPGIADRASAPRGRATDEQLARDVERDGVDAFLERWLAQPMFATLPRDARAASTNGRRSTPSNAHPPACACSAQARRTVAVGPAR